MLCEYATDVLSPHSFVQAQIQARAHGEVATKSRSVELSHKSLRG